MNENTFWAIFWICLTIIIVGSVAILDYGYTNRTTEAIKNGYEEGTVPGSSQAMWIKSKP